MQYAASFVGWSNTGKTQLIRRLTALLSARGRKVGTLKSGHSQPQFEVSGKDTEIFFDSGAERVGFISPHGAFVRYKQAPPVEALLAQFASCDILLIEGSVSADIPCFELIRTSADIHNSKFPPEQLAAYISMNDNAADAVDAGRSTLPILPGRDPESILQFLEELWNAKSV
ncbi:MAG: molybdopterin-guanine dinucleotide biosynthesis protein B [Spirochaetota bacterium]